MTGLARLIRSRRGSAAVEMALVTPLLLALGIGSVELGNFMLDQHRLTKSVRDAARYAARAPFGNYAGCSGVASNVPSTPDNVPAYARNLVRYGQLSPGSDQLPGWVTATISTQITVQMTCTTTAGGQNMLGIYTGNAAGDRKSVV